MIEAILASLANFMLSEKGKKASDAKTAPSKLLFLSQDLLAFIMANCTESTLLVLPDPIPIVVLFLAITIALDLTYLTTLNAKTKSSISFFDGFFSCYYFQFAFCNIKFIHILY